MNCIQGNLNRNNGPLDLQGDFAVGQSVVLDSGARVGRQQTNSMPAQSVALDEEVVAVGDADSHSTVELTVGDGTSGAVEDQVGPVCGPEAVVDEFAVRQLQ